MVVTLVWTVLVFVGAAAADETWPRFRTPGFMVTGEAPERDLRRAADDLEAFRSALAKLYPEAAVQAAEPTTVVIFKDHRRFAQFLPRDAQGRPMANVSGYFLPNPDRDYIVSGPYGGEIERRVILHEYAHSVLHRTMGSMPLWLSEGLAGFYSTFDRNPTFRFGILGRPPADFLAVLRANDFIGLQRIVSAQDGERLRQDGDRARMFYAVSWALVHYLLIGSPHASSANVGRFLSALTRAVPAGDAFRDAFGESIDDVDIAVRSYVRRFDFKGMAVEGATPLPETIQGPPLSAAEGHRLRGDLLLRVGTIDAAEGELAAALEQDPRDLDARIAMARVRLATPRDAEGVEALQRAASEVPTSFAAQYYLGAALALRRRYEEAFSAFDRAVRLRDRSASAWFAFSTTALALGLDDAAEASLNRAMRLEFNPSSYRNRAYAAFAFGRHEVAATDARRFIDTVGLRDPAAQMVALVGAIAYWRANQPAQARALLEEVRKVTPRASWNAELVDYLLGRTTAEHLLSHAKTHAQKTSAHIYAGLKAAIEGRTQEALAHLRWVRAEGLHGDGDYGIAIEELARIEMLQLELR